MSRPESTEPGQGAPVDARADVVLPELPKWLSPDIVHAYASAAVLADRARAVSAPPAAHGEWQRASQWGRLYTAAAALTAKIGADGDVESDHATVDSLMDALHALDGGQWMPGLMPAQAPGWQDIETAPADTPLLLGWRDGSGEWVCFVGVARDTRGGWAHGAATHWKCHPTAPGATT